MDYHIRQMAVLNLASLRDTRLWKKLHERFSGSDAELAQTLAGNLLTISEEAADRMRAFPSLHPQYTIHDEKHLLRVTELMSLVLPPEVLEEVLNPVEIALLILSAHFHDQGMVLERREIATLSMDSEFRIFRERWEIDHSNYREVRSLIASKTTSEQEKSRLRSVEQELDAALLTDFIRTTHGSRSEKFIRSNYRGDRRWEVSRVNLADFVARLALSHVHSAQDLISKEHFRFDEAVGQYRVNMVYLALILRIADILDFDRDRTPDVLYRTIDFTSRISLQEWEKHRSVDGWIIRSDVIQFTMRCAHPEYQRAAYAFMDWIDAELANGAEIARQFPAEFSKYRWSLPLRTDRSRISPIDGSYIYQDLEFSLSRDEVVRLLMMEELYGGPWLCVRELLQNSLDALRFRRALYKREDEIDWDRGSVSFRHYKDDLGREVLRCTDNGSGMDLDIIGNYLLKVGRSYYKSPEFEVERVKLRAAGVDFEPCSQFGIGFMSCFMLGDQIRIWTRRDKPGNGKSSPLEIEINGLGGMIVVRPGSASQRVGTTVEIALRIQPRRHSPSTDQVRLLDILKLYAVASEFSIEGECSIEGISGKVSIEPGVRIAKTLLEEAGVGGSITESVDFSEIHPLLSGKIRVGFLADSSGRLCLADGQWRWQVIRELGSCKYLLHGEGATFDLHDFARHNKICIDGILVSGLPDKSKDRHLGTYNNPPFTRWGSSFILDIRGSIKPPLTPSRFPSEWADFILETGGWEYISWLCGLTEGRVWERIATRCASENLDPSLFWKLERMYAAAILSMRKGAIWDLVTFPVATAGRTKWMKLDSIGRITAQPPGHAKYAPLTCDDGSRIEPPSELDDWGIRGNVRWDVRNLLLSMCSLIETSGTLRFAPTHPRLPAETPSDFKVRLETPHPLIIPYQGALQGFVAAVLPEMTFNRDHPLISLAVETRFLKECSDLVNFARILLRFAGDPKVIEAMRSPLDHGDRKLLDIGDAFEAVDWGSVDSAYAPPFRLRDIDGSEIALSEDIMRSWSKGS